MSPEQYQKAKSIFLSICDLRPQERTSRAEQLAGDDREVLRQVMVMIENDTEEELGGGLREGLDAILRGAASAETAMPESIGPYRVVRRIGRGGMGEVFEAEQETPRRRVAIKLMRAGLGSEAMTRRFRREIEFLGGLSHAGIARVYEAGVARIGGASVPYCVMEYVDGLPLTEYARAKGLGLRAKLRLFAAICDIVQYAHQQGVIHRDLKPANILVQEGAGARVRDENDPRRAETGGGGADDALARILDFGIARRVDVAEGFSGTLATEAGEIFGTVPYMSPEQMSGRPGAVDTRTDVYALGVILFELLTGELPQKFEGLSVLDAAKVKQTEPARRLGALDAALRGDLETVVGKALEAEKERRYGSASEFAQDVRRYLADEVIAARPASATDQLRKFVRRNRAAAIAACVSLAALVVGAGATLVQARVAIRERDVALRKTEVAEAVSGVLLEALTVATPKGAMGKEPRLIDAIERIQSQAFDETSALSPEVRAVVMNIIGIIHRERGDFERAEKVLGEALAIRRRVLEPGDPNLADSLNNMGLLRRKQGRFAEAAEFMREAVELQRASAFRDDARLARNIYNLGSAYIASGELDKAGPLLDEAEAMHRTLLGEKHEIHGIVLSARSRLAAARGDLPLACEYAARATAMFRETVGPVHPSIASSLRDEGLLAEKRGATGEALERLIAADAIAHEVFALEPPHPTLRAIREDLARVMKGAGREDESARLLGDLNAMPGVQ